MALTKVTQSMIDGPYVDPAQFGAVGDGVTDDSTALQACSDYLYGLGGGVMTLYANKEYNVGSKALYIRGDVSIEGNGATISKTSIATDGMIIRPYPQDLSAQRTINVGSSKYETSVTTSTASDAGDFSSGDVVLMQWGTDPYDVTQRYASYIAKVASSNASTGVISLSSAIPYDWAYSTSPSIRKLTGAWSGFIRNITIKSTVPSPGICNGIYLGNAYEARIENVKSIDVTGATVVSAYCTSIDIDGIINEYIEAVDAGLERGRSFNSWSSQYISVDAITDNNTRDYANSAVFIESGCRGIIISNSHMSGTGVAGAFGVTVNGGSEDILLSNNIVENFVTAFDVTEASEVYFKNNVIRKGGAQPLRAMVIDYIGNTVESGAKMRNLNGLATVNYTTSSIAVGISTFLTASTLSNAITDGIVVGLSWKLSNGPITQGTLTIEVFNSAAGIQSTSTAVTGDGEVIFNFNTENTPAIMFDAGDSLNVRVTASADLLPAATLDLEANLLVAY